MKKQTHTQASEKGRNPAVHDGPETTPQRHMGSGEARGSFFYDKGLNSMWTWDGLYMSLLVIYLYIYPKEVPIPP